MDKRLRRGLNIALGAVAAAGAAALLVQQLRWHASAAAQEKALRAAQFTPPAVSGFPASGAPGPEAPAGADDPVAQELAGLDLASLRAVNPDVAGWLYIPGTNISHPVCQGPDNDYYLKHTWEKKWNGGGAIFLDWRSARDFEGFHTIVYGHRMNNGTMFGALHGYEEEQFWREHPYVYVADGAQVRRYEVFAAWEPAVGSLVYTLDSGTPEARQEFVELCAASSWIETGVAPGPEDKVLTLSTCTGHGHDTRWVVQARLEQVYQLPGGE